LWFFPDRAVSNPRLGFSGMVLREMAPLPSILSPKPVFSVAR
jgi:hypothetical protein